jgi:hypothetical protein
LKYPEEVIREKLPHHDLLMWHTLQYILEQDTCMLALHHKEAFAPLQEESRGFPEKP